MAVAAPRRRRGDLNPKGDPWAAWMHIDLALIVGVLGLAGVGLGMIYSATRGTDPEAFDRTFLERQTIFVMVGLAVMATTAMLPYDRLKAWAPLVYGGGMLGLVGVLTPLGVERNGAQAWFEFAGFQLQPSEFLKVAFIVLLASFVSRFDGDLEFSHLAMSLGIVAAPLALIMLQPDVGTGLVFVSVTMGMLLVGGARFRHIVALTLLGIASVLVIWNAGILQEYQQERLVSFIDPASSDGDAAYQQTQAQIAIGSGGMRGQGWGQGDQTRGEFVPEQHTDFIFTVVGEELGFVGAASVLGLFALVVWRVWRTAVKAADPFGSLVCIGVLTMLVFQVFQSVGMTLGIMPITGIPVPFLSYGGSSALTTFVSMGLVLNVHMRRHQVLR